MEEKKRTIITQILQQSLHRFQSACLPEGTGPPVSVCWNVWRDEVQYKHRVTSHVCHMTHASGLCMRPYYAAVDIQ